LLISRDYTTKKKGATAICDNAFLKNSPACPKSYKTYMKLGLPLSLIYFHKWLTRTVLISIFFLINENHVLALENP